MKVDYRRHELPFAYPFTISGGRTKTHQPTFIVQLSLGALTGYGEAPAIQYYDISTTKMSEDLERKRMFVEKFAFTVPDRFWHYLHHLFPANPFLVCALDMAGWDLYGKMVGKPLYELWSDGWKDDVLTDYTIGIGSIEDVIEKAKNKPWPIYKIKLGTPNDLKVVESLRAETNAIIRVDANGGWTLDEALHLIPKLEEMQIELVEQPLAKDNWEGMAELYRKFSLPLIADESCVAESDVVKCKDHFHGINIKLTKCSGPTPALRMIKKAKELNLRVMMGSMNESTLGTAAIANALPLLDLVDADGPLLLANDLATGVHFNFGRISLDNKPGLGVEVTGFDK